MPDVLADGDVGGAGVLVVGCSDVDTLPGGSREVPPAGRLVGRSWPAQAVAMSSNAPVPATFAKYLMPRKTEPARPGVARKISRERAGRGLGGRPRAARHRPPSVRGGQPWRNTTVRVPSGSVSAS